MLLLLHGSNLPSLSVTATTFHLSSLVAEVGIMDKDVHSLYVHQPPLFRSASTLMLPFRIFSL